jgi:hypothetical protein
MLKNTLLILGLLVGLCATAQDNSSYFYKPFSIYKVKGEQVMAGSVNTFVYKDYYGKNIQKEPHGNAHLKPEYLVYELFNDMKNKDFNSITTLYDSSFKKDNFDKKWMTDKLRDYADIKLRSKFRSGDLIIVRYDFVSADRKKSFPFFAIVKKAGDGYYLSADIDTADPFNLIGSLSPDNHFERGDESIITAGMTPFYFIRKEDKILLASGIPVAGQNDEDYTTLYLRLESYDKKKVPAPIEELLEQMQRTAQQDDTALFKNFVIAGDLPLLEQEHFHNYYYAGLMRIFKNYPMITPLAGLKINGGEVLYFKFADSLNSRIAYIILKNREEKYSLELQFKDEVVSNILLDDYIVEAIVGYLKQP